MMYHNMANFLQKFSNKFSWKKKNYIMIQLSHPIKYKWVMVQVWHQIYAKPLPKPMMNPSCDEYKHHSASMS